MIAAERAPGGFVRTPFLKLDGDGTPVCLRITSEIWRTLSTGREFMDVTNLKTGQVCHVFVNTVLGDNLRNTYANGSYVGRDFQIRKFAPQGGKKYATFEIDEIRLLAEENHNLETRIERSKQQGTFASGEDNPLELSYDDYRKTKLWRKISRRVLKRDGKLCRRCGGSATMVHHRSYAAEVMLGNADEQLASICEGCHDVIHYDENRKKRSTEETDSLLLEGSVSIDFPEPKIDLRTDKVVHPAEWGRMSAVERKGYCTEYQRMRLIRLLQRGPSPEEASEIRRRLKEWYGMDDSAIDHMMAKNTPRRK